MLFEQTRHAVAIGKVEFDETQSVRFCQRRAAGFLQRRVVIGIQVINANDVAAVTQKTLRNVKADKPGGSGYQNGAVSHRLRPTDSPFVPRKRGPRTEQIPEPEIVHWIPA